jgi:predicted short-subunit dehydrogenase-like oxidoreductase (DUF2520 family)
VPVREHHQLSVVASLEKLLDASVEESDLGIRGDNHASVNLKPYLHGRVSHGVTRIKLRHSVMGKMARCADRHEHALRHLRILPSDTRVARHPSRRSTLNGVTESGPPRLRVGIIGAGRVGAVLGAALRRAGHQVTGVSAVSDLSRLRAEALLPGVPIVDIPAVTADADLVLIAIPDDALAPVVAGLAETGNVHAGQFWCHPSGGHGIEILDPATRAGALPLALHPVMTFTGTSVDLARLEECPFGVTAPEVLRPVAEALVVEMGGDPIWVPEENRALYHAALSYGANYLITLVAQSLELLTTAGIEQPQRIIAPLLSASLDNALRLGDHALTGPVARGDAESVARQLAAIARVSEQAAVGYQALARVTADRAVASGTLAPHQAAELLGVLGMPTGSGEA